MPIVLSRSNAPALSMFASTLLPYERAGTTPAGEQPALRTGADPGAAAARASRRRRRPDRPRGAGRGGQGAVAVAPRRVAGLAAWSSPSIRGA